MLKSLCAISPLESKKYANKTMNKMQSAVSSFFYSDIYLILIALVIVLGWRLEVPLLPLVCIIVSGCLIMVFMDDVTPLIPFLFCITFIFPQGVTASKYLGLWPMLIPFVVSIVYHVIYFRPQKFKLGKLFFPQLAICIALICGGLGSNLTPSGYTNGLDEIATLGPLLLVLYFFFVNYADVKKGQAEVYYAKSLLLVSMVLVAEMFLFMVCNKNYGFFDITHNMIDLGAISCNGAATVIMMGVPCSFYLMRKMPKFTAPLMVLAVIQYVAVFFTYSRGAMLFAFIVAPFVFVYSFWKTSEKKQKISWLIALGASLAVVLIVYFSMMDCFNQVISEQVLRSTATDTDFSSGRMDLYREALSVFAAYPAFGVGIGYVGINYTPGASGTFWFHSTFFQIIGCMGIIGLLLYVYGYYGRFRILLSNIKKNPFNFFILAGIVAFEGYSLINNGTFLGIPLMLMVTAMTFMVEKSNQVVPEPDLLADAV